jgi:hypothetical protein
MANPAVVFAIAGDQVWPDPAVRGSEALPLPIFRSVAIRCEDVVAEWPATPPSAADAEDWLRANHVGRKYRDAVLDCAAALGCSQAAAEAAWISAGLARPRGRKRQGARTP